MEDTTPEQEVSEQSVEDRLAGILEAEDEAPEQENAEAEDEQYEADDPEQAEPEDDTEEVEYEGKAYKLPKELKDAVLRQSDYTKKTQEVANLRRQVEDRQMFLQAKEQLISVAANDLAELRALEKEAERFKSLDWTTLHQTDPAQAVGLMQRQQLLKDQIGELRGRLGGVAQQVQAATQQHIDRQWEMAVQGARQRIGKFTSEDDKAALQQALELGFSHEEIKSKLADERLLIAVFKAAKWDALQRSKPAVTKKAVEARPMKATSRSAPQAQMDGRAAEARARLRKTGDSSAAEALLERMFKKR